MDDAVWQLRPVVGRWCHPAVSALCARGRYLRGGGLRPVRCRRCSSVRDRGGRHLMALPL